MYIFCKSVAESTISSVGVATLGPVIKEAEQTDLKGWLCPRDCSGGCTADCVTENEKHSGQYCPSSS